MFSVKFVIPLICFVLSEDSDKASAKQQLKPLKTPTDASTKIYKSNKYIIHNGFPSSLLDFQVVKTDRETNSTWICNRAQFALTMRFETFTDDTQNATITEISLKNTTTVNEEESNCETLVLNFNPDPAIS